MKKMCFFILLLPMILSAQSISDYIPLAVGNYWIQHSDIFQGGNNPVTFTMEIEGIDQINDLDYMRRFNSFETDDGLFISSWWTWLRVTEDGIDLGAFGDDPDISNASVTIFDPPLLWFSNELMTVGSTYQVDIPEMGGTYTFTAEEWEPEITVPAGTFTNCLHISLIITDGGSTTQTSDFYFAEDVGEIHNVTLGNNFYGDLNLDLIEYNVQTSSPQIVIASENCKLGNYPNPFNPTTSISFDIKENETGTLTLFNIKGQIIESQQFESGNHNYLWDAANQTSGIYLYKLQTQTITETRKMLLLK
ncbi:MAG: T9SS type A sorting domain-containing protein [Candidatus Cloacimonetes bacterium]|jgi:hypothetical protein|nr:T9SS type A sorting domain-containing protein [Candidatus Cloacimonadota bacterium]